MYVFTCFGVSLSIFTQQ